MCRCLWIPSAEADGIPYQTIITLVNSFSQWRDEHLDRVGVPSNFEADWDFVAAVTACKLPTIVFAYSTHSTHSIHVGFWIRFERCYVPCYVDYHQ